MASDGPADETTPLDMSAPDTADSWLLRALNSYRTCKGLLWASSALLALLGAFFLFRRVPLVDAAVDAAVRSRSYMERVDYGRVIALKAALKRQAVMAGGILLVAAFVLGYFGWNLRSAPRLYAWLSLGTFLAAAAFCVPCVPECAGAGVPYHFVILLALGYAAWIATMRHRSLDLLFDFELDASTRPADIALGARDRSMEAHLRSIAFWIRAFAALSIAGVAYGTGIVPPDARALRGYGVWGWLAFAACVGLAGALYKLGDRLAERSDRARLAAGAFFILHLLIMGVSTAHPVAVAGLVEPTGRMEAGQLFFMAPFLLSLPLPYLWLLFHPRAAVVCGEPYARKFSLPAERQPIYLDLFFWMPFVPYVVAVLIGLLLFALVWTLRHTLS